MSDKRIPILTPEGKFSFIDERFGDEVVRAGGRVLTKKEAEEKQASDARQEAQAREDARYEAQSPVGKALGAASTIASAMTPGTALTFGAGASPGTAPAAYSGGVTEGLTAGLGPGLVRQGIDATLGHDAGDKYAQSITDQKLASPIAHGAGNLVGTTAGIVAPAGAAAENIAGRGVARALGYAGVEGSGAIAKAVTQAAKLGTRGAVEGGIIGGGDYVGDQLLQDHDVAADKLFSAIGTGALYGGATGAVLGGGSSLLSSGSSSARRGVASLLARPSEAAAEVAAGAEAGAQGITRGAETVARDAEGMAKSGIRAFASDLTTEAGTKARAYDRAWSAIGSGFGLQSTEYAQKAAKFLPNGTRDVGEVLMRKGILDPKWTTVEAVTKGTPAAMVPKIDTALEAVGQQLGKITDASEGTIPREAIVQAFRDVGDKYNAAAATRPIARELDRFGAELADSLGLNTTVQTKVSVQDLLRERKALDHMVWENAALNTSSVGTQVKRELRSKLEGLIVNSLDESSGRLSGELANEYKALKKDYLALMIASDVATDSATRAQKAAFLGLSSLAAGGGSLIKSLAHKVVKEHGDAVAAAMLYQAAEKGTLIRWLNKTDSQIARASKGLTALPEKGTPKAAELMPPPRAVVTTALARVAAFQADPDAFVDHASQQTESIATHSPEIASGIVQRQVKAMIFLSSKVPQQGDPDPLDPRKTPEMTPTEQAQFAKYAWYTEKPERFFAEVARGKLTPEGAETAQALMPRAFEQLQAQTFDALTTQLARGNKLPFRQRQILGELLDFAATPAQRPQHRTFLQGNVSDVPPSDPMLASNQQISPAAKASSRRPMLSQSGSALDRLEANGPGRRRT